MILDVHYKVMVILFLAFMLGSGVGTFMPFGLQRSLVVLFGGTCLALLVARWI